MPSTLLTPEELAQRWSLQVASLKAMRRRRQGPPWVVVGNNSVRYRLTDVERFERERRVQPQATTTTNRAAYTQGAER
jgi:hypothetical protein